MVVGGGFRSQGWQEMALSNRYARILAAGGAAVLAATLTAAPAMAAITWTIQPGGAITATSGRLALKDTTIGTVISCASSTASGTLRSGSGLSGSDAGSLSAVSFVHCTAPGGPNDTLQPGGLPWHVNFSSYNAATGVARGTIGKIHIALSQTASCTALIDGTSATARDGRATFRYTDSTGRITVLTTGSNLHIYDVSQGCLGQYDSGDSAALSISYTVSPKQDITSP
jgi:hypothetical protein